MIRKTLYPEIRRRLDRPPLLVPEDFDISTSSRYGLVELQITYAIEEGQYFKAAIANQKSDVSGTDKPRYDFKIALEYSPGEIVREERAETAGLKSFFAYLESWVGRLVDEIKADPLYRSLQSHDSKLRDIEKQLEKLPDDFATPEQVEKLHEWLSVVEVQVREQIKQLQLDTKETQARLEELEKEFGLLRERVSSSKVRRAFRAILGRVYRVASDPNLGKLLENGQKVAGLLTGGTQQL